MAKIIDAGLVPSDDPMFTNSFQVFSPHGSKRLTASSHKSTASKQTHNSNKASERRKPFSQMSDKEHLAYLETMYRDHVKRFQKGETQHPPRQVSLKEWKEFLAKDHPVF
jgi:hypothetical protein